MTFYLLYVFFAPERRLMPPHANQYENARILVIDDDEASTYVVTRTLRNAGYVSVAAATDMVTAVDLFSRLEPDLVLLDLRLPGTSGLELMGIFRAQLSDDDFLPFIILTVDVTREARQLCLAAGANDFLTKPFDPDEALLRIRNLLHMRMLHVRCQREMLSLDDRVRERTREVVQAQMEIIDRLSTAAESRDLDTGCHTGRVGDLVAGIAENLSLPQPEISVLRRAAPLHDIGKIAIPDSILLKPGPLTADEFEIMKSHTVIGARILSGSRFPMLNAAEQIALTHHENWDGSGYPSNLSGDNIPLGGRIVAIADVFDALTNIRPYKPAWPVEKALDEIRSLSGTKFDPAIVEAFLAVEAESRL